MKYFVNKHSARTAFFFFPSCFSCPALTPGRLLPNTGACCTALFSSFFVDFRRFFLPDLSSSLSPNTWARNCNVFRFRRFSTVFVSSSSEKVTKRFWHSISLKLDRWSAWPGSSRSVGWDTRTGHAYPTDRLVETCTDTCTYRTYQVSTMSLQIQATAW